MKKNMIMKIASVLMVLTLASTCAISGTFAKYVTSAKSENLARVAKFGIEVTAAGEADSLFKTDYNKPTGASTTIETTVSSEAVPADSTTPRAKVVAPGTEGTLGAFKIEGKAEVAVNVAFSATLDLGENWKVTPAGATAEEEYCPLVFTIRYKNVGATDETSTTIKMEGEINTIEKLENAVIAEIAKVTNNYAPNTAIESNGSLLEVSWAWAFEGTNTDAYQTDEKDTLLGKKANTANTPTIDFNITCTVTQID